MKKINVGNDQHLWRKALGKQLKKSEKHKKAKNQKHGRKMLWSDKESKIPTIILDECIYSDTLHEKVHALGYNVLFMGSGLPDDKIREYIMQNPKTVLVTADKEFDAHFSWKQCFLCENEQPGHELVPLIKEFMWIHEEEAKEQ